MDQRGVCPVSQFGAGRWISCWLVPPLGYHPHLELMSGEEGGAEERGRGRRRSRRKVWKRREGEEERNTFPANY